MRGRPSTRTHLNLRSKSRAIDHRQHPPDPKCLFVGNLAFSCSTVDLFTIFQRYGRIAEVHLPIFLGTSKPRGYGFIKYCYEDDARAAIEVLDGKKIDGRTVIVKVANPKHSIHLPGSNLGPNPTPPEISCHPQQPSNNRGWESTSSVMPPKPQPAASFRRENPYPDGSVRRVHPSRPCINKLFSGKSKVTADPSFVSKKLSDLELALVASTCSTKCSILCIIDGFRASHFRALAMDVAHISQTQFFICFKSKNELLEFVADNSI